MGLHAAIIRLSPLIHEGEQRYKPYIVGDPRMVSLSVFEKSWLRPGLWFIHETQLLTDSSFKLKVSERQSYFVLDFWKGKLMNKIQQ